MDAGTPSNVLEMPKRQTLTRGNNQNVRQCSQVYMRGLCARQTGGTGQSEGGTDMSLVVYLTLVCIVGALALFLDL